MQTSFTPEQLRDPEIATANEELRKCVHCGFCMATCPTYLLTGDELEAPRGRIYQIRTILEAEETSPPWTVLQHLDTCLTCLSCTTTCPSGVGYDRLIDLVRRKTARAKTRPAPKRWLRKVLINVVPFPSRLRSAAKLGRLAAPLLMPLLNAVPGLRPFTALLEPAHRQRPSRPLFGDYPPLAEGPGQGRRVALLTGCAQSVFGRDISEATLHVLRMSGFHVVIPQKAGCCGAMEAHLGEHGRALMRAAANVRAWAQAGVEAVVIDASGCAGTVKDYAELLKDDAELAEPAARLAQNTFELAELLFSLPERPAWHAPRPVTIMWHAPCSLTHHLRMADLPKNLLEDAGYVVLEPAEAHLCCGAGGANAVLEPDVAAQLRQRKLSHLQLPGAEAIASANFGCIQHMAAEARMPILHYAQLLAWALHGPDPLLRTPANSPSAPACAGGTCGHH